MVGIVRLAVAVGLSWLAMISYAIADPGGWEWWRVALATWPIANLLGALAVFLLAEFEK